MEQQKISHQQTREFFIQIPAFLDYLALSAHEFRLYTHYLRVCGDSGKCWESVRTTAANSNISRGSVTNARSVLEEKFQLIYTNKKQLEEDDTDKQTQIHIKIRDVWEINTRFLTLIRKHGMPSLPAARKWLMYQLTQEVDDSPFDKKAISSGGDSPDIHFNIPRPSGGHPVHDVDTRPSDGHPVHDVDGVSTERAPCPPDGHKQIYSNKISLNEIPENQIEGIAAAAGDNSSVEENRDSDLDSRARDGVPESKEPPFDDPIWWNLADQFVSCSGAKRLCRAYMDLDDWRDQEEILQGLDEGGLFNLLLWLHYTKWNGVNMMENGIQNIPGYIRSRLGERPPSYSQRDIEELVEKIRERSGGPPEDPEEEIPF